MAEIVLAIVKGYAAQGAAQPGGRGTCAKNGRDTGALIRMQDFNFLFLLFRLIPVNATEARRHSLFWIRWPVLRVQIRTPSLNMGIVVRSFHNDFLLFEWASQ